MSKTFLLIILAVTVLVIGGLWYATSGTPIPAGPTAAAATSSLEVTLSQQATSTDPSTPADSNQTMATTTLDTATSTPTTTSDIDLTKKYMNATLHTNYGDITIQFLDKGVPNTVANFIKLAGTHFYDGVKFHRVIKGFMIQGGDPLTKDDSQKSLWGTGGPGYTFNDELSADNHDDLGTIAMANSGPNTNGSQFFINVAANNFLDTKHVVFGKVTAGMDVVMKISETKTDSNDRPIDPVIINSITLK